MSAADDIAAVLYRKLPEAKLLTNGELLKIVSAVLASQPKAPAPVPVAQGEAIDKAHLPDLRYIRMFLLGLRDKKHRSGDLSAAINGINYVISRTESATPAPEQATTGSGQADRLKSAFDESYGLGHRDGMEDCRPMGGSGYGLESCWEDSETRAAILSTASPAGEVKT